MYTLDPKQVILTIAGALITGYADGSYVAVEYNEDAFKLKVGADGLAGRAKTNNDSAKITISLMPNSPSNAVLNALAALDRATSAGAVPLTLADLASGEAYGALGAWVMKRAGRDFQTEITAKVWVIETDDLSQVIAPVAAVLG